MSKRDEFVKLLKSYGVTKCNVGMGFNPNARYSGGLIFVNVDDDNLIKKIFRMYTRENDLDTPDGEELGIMYSNFRSKESNFDLS